MQPRNSRLSRTSDQFRPLMWRNSLWWPIQNSPITAKLRANPPIRGRASRSCRPDSTWATSGTWRSTISRVIAMAKTASLKNTTRSYSSRPALARTRRRSEGAAMGGSVPTRLARPRPAELFPTW